MLSLASAVILESEFHGTHDHILLSQIRDSTNLEGQVPILISPKNRVAQIYPQELGSLFIASYDSQGYGGGIRTRLNTGFFKGCFFRVLYINAVRTSQETHYVSATKASRLMLFRKRIAV
jgi:hypothetical protein